MSLIQYILILITCYLGIIGGYFLAIIAPEELKKGRKYFVFLGKIIIILIISFLIWHQGINYFTGFYMALILLVCILSERYMEYIYPLTAIALFLSKESMESLIYQSSFIFILGMVMGSLFMAEHEKNEKIENKIKLFFLLFLRYIFFVIIGLLFCFIS